MRIGIDIRELSSLHTIKNGLYQYTYNLISNLLDIDIQNEYVLLSAFRHDNEIRKIGNRVKSRVKKIPGRLSFLLLEKLDIPIEFVIGKINIFHGPCDFVPKSLKGNSVVTIHDLIPIRLPELTDRETEISLTRKIHSSVKRADVIIAISNFTKQQIIESLDIPDERIKVIYNGIAPIFYPRNDENILDNIKMKYQINAPYLLFVGSIEPRKNLETLVRACVELKNSTVYRYPLVVVGHKDWHFDAVWQVVCRLQAEDAIIFTGVVEEDDLPVLYSGAEAFVFPSFAEGFGIPVIEAMACGTPVVASNRTSIPEIAAGAALLVDASNPEALAGAMCEVLSKPALRQCLIAKGLERAKAFSWEKTARETLALYAEVGGR